MNIIFDNILEHFDKCSSNNIPCSSLLSCLPCVSSVYHGLQVCIFCWYNFLCFFYFNFFTAITSFRLWLMKVDVEVIIKYISIVGRFLFLDNLLFAYLLAKIVHFSYVQICLKILFIRFSATVMCTNNGKRIDVANDNFFISMGDKVLFSMFPSSITFCSNRNRVLLLMHIIDHFLVYCCCEVELFADPHWVHTIDEKIRVGFLFFSVKLGC